MTSTVEAARYLALRGVRRLHDPGQPGQGRGARSRHPSTASRPPPARWASSSTLSSRPDAVGPDAVAGVERYLLPTEQRVLAVRRHWSVLIGPVFLVVAATLLLFWLDDRLPPRLPYVRDALLLGWVVLAGLLVWRLLELAPGLVRRDRPQVAAAQRHHHAHGRHDAAAQGDGHELRPAAGRPAARLRRDRDRVGRSGPGDAPHLAPAAPRRPLRRDL